MLFVKGMVIGLSIAAPVGVIGILCIQRSLKYGRWIGFLSGLGAATADMLYGAIAAFGLKTIADFLLTYSNWLQIIGGVFLILLGLKFLFSNSQVPTVQEQDVSKKNAFTAYLSAFFLTITNPLTIIMFLGIFSGAGVIESSKGKAPLLMVLGVFAGSALWWFLLSFFSSFFRQKLTGSLHVLLQKVSALLIMVFGLYGLSKAL